MFPVELEWIRRFARETKAPPGKLIDLGSQSKHYRDHHCGGYDLAEIFGREVVNVDIVPYDGVDVVADAADIRWVFGENAMAIVVACNILQYVRDIQKVVSSVHYVLMSGGEAIFIVPFVYNREDTYLVRTSVEDIWIKDRNRVSLEQLKDAALKAGFMVVECGTSDPNGETVSVYLIGRKP